MFSSIDEVWGNDPVREMTKKLNNGKFNNDTGLSNAFNFKSHSNDTNTSRVMYESSDTVNRYDNTSPFMQKRIDTDPNTSELNRLAFKSPKRTKFIDSDIFYGDQLPMSDIMSDSILHNTSDTKKCLTGIKHVKRCKSCQEKLNVLINKKIKKKIDSALVDFQLSQIRSGSASNNYQISNGIMAESTKETLIIMSGIIVTFFLMFLIVKCIAK